MDLMIPENETIEWLAESDIIKSNVFLAYRNTIHDVVDVFLKDPRLLANAHIVNPDFATTPKYLIGFQQHRGQGILVLSVLYVYEQYRNKGLSTKLINQLKMIVNRNGVVQVAVCEEDLDRLHSFYVKQGFSTTGDVIENGFGRGYCDYFWSDHKIQLRREGDIIMIKEV